MEVPPLRDRRRDIPDLAAHFTQQACGRFHLPNLQLRPWELERAQQYDWPGNVRELQNIIERAVIASRGGHLTLDLPEASQTALAPIPICSEPGEVIPEEEWRSRERANILAVLKRARFRVSGKGGAAEPLGVNPTTLASRLKVLGINERDYLRSA